MPPTTTRFDDRGYPIKEPPFGVWDDNGVLWNSSSVGKFTETYDEKVKTVYDVVHQSFPTHGDRRAVGQRTLIKREFVEDPANPGKKFEKLTLGEYTWLTYSEWAERIRNFGSGMMSFGKLQPRDRVLIYAETQRDWMTAALASFNHALTIVTAYATLGADAAKYAINQTQSKVVVADGKLLKVLLTVAHECPTLKAIIAMTSDLDEASKKKLEDAGISVCTFDEAVDSGKAAPVDLTPPKPEDTAVLMYTSGTTGNPKGVVLLHSCLVAAMSGVDGLLGQMVSPDDVYIAYLPLAHSMELVAEMAQLKVGLSVGFGSPHTLTNTSVKLAPGQTGDIVVLKPTIVVFAPLVLEKIYNSIQAKVAGGGFIKKWLFDTAMAAGIRNYDEKKIGAPAFWNSIVFKNVQAIAGGRLRLIITGSAPLDGNVQKFVQTCFNCPVKQGYGATETCAASVVQEILDNRVQSVGPPRTSCCVKLIDWEEGNYRTSDKDDPKIGKPRGEIVIGGPLIAAGYLVDTPEPDEDVVEKNKTDFKTDENGVRWFYTGDIGQVDDLGCLQIIDRKKDLIKLQQGEYVSLSKVEGVLKLASLVENALLHVDPKQKYCTALVCPALPALSALCKEKGYGDDMEAACSNKDVVAEVLAQCRAAAKGRLASFEIPTKVTLVPPSRTWTPENDLLTAAMKLKRKPIINAHQAEIDAMYK